jgi:Spy/CpxP family protein refolding chaperone
MKQLLSFTLLSLLLCSGVFAQKVDDSLRYAESIWSMQKKAMILEQMDLTEAEKSAFWPVYESYANAIQYLDMEYIRLLNYTPEDLTEKKAASLAENMLMNELLLAKTRKQYYRKFSKALTPAQAGKFMQIDNNFRTMLRIQMQKESPTLLSSLSRFNSRN